jgi:hypothetical protein
MKCKLELRLTCPLETTTGAVIEAVSAKTGILAVGAEGIRTETETIIAANVVGLVVLGGAEDGTDMVRA